MDGELPWETPAPASDLRRAPGPPCAGGSTVEDDQSAKFIHRMFSHAARDRIAILAVPRSAGNAEQRVVTLAQASSPKYLAWLRHLNARDYDIYLCVNPIRPGSRGREKSDIAEVRRLQLDLDEDGPTGYARVLEDVERGALPRPAHILRSSKDRYQFLWDTVPDRWSHEQAEAVMRGLAQRYGGDRAATDVARVMRLPGFRNCKPGRARSLITWTWYGGRMVRPEDFRGLALPEREPASRAEGRRRIPPGHHSQSERDWAAAGDALRKGEAPETVISRLEQQRQDKPNPGYYARRTVQRKAEELKKGYQDDSGKSR